MGTQYLLSASIEIPSEHRDTPSHSPLVPEVCLHLQRPFSSVPMPPALFAHDETDQFHPLKPNYHAPTYYSTQAPVMVQVSPGIWFDGNRHVMSASHPDVKAFVAEARRTLKLPLPPSEVVFVLAALEVFYNPGDPVHWLFWSDEKKHVTADVVTRISLHQPSLIRSNVAWNGTPEYLSILANHHGSTWRQLFEDQDWYQLLVPPKSGMLKMPNLRKRKVAPGAMREASRSPSPDEQEPDEPVPKKSRNVDVKGVDTQPVSNSVSAETDIPPRTAASPAISDNSMPLEELAPADTLPSITELLPEKKVPTSRSRPNGRQQRRRKRPAAVVTIEQCPAASSSSRASSDDLADGTQTSSSVNNKSSSTSNAHLRNRSTSHASAETLVGLSHDRRSSSVLSASTAVDGGTEKGKDPKHKEIQGKSCETENKSEDPDGSTNEADEGESVGVVTRGRARGKGVEKTLDTGAVNRTKPLTSSANPKKRSKKSRS